MKEKKKIGFVFYDDIHHIHHFLGPFVELYKNKNYNVEIITFEAEHQYLVSLLELYDIPKTALRKTPTFFYRKILNKLKKRKKPSPVFLVKKNKKLLLSYDVLVFVDSNHEYLYKRRQGKTPKFAFLGHGSGERSYIYNDKVATFDLISVSGEKVLKLFETGGDFSQTNIKVCGYQKFDVVRVENKNIKLFNNNKPTVLYNPHFEHNLSSFYKIGLEVLEFFYKHNEFNLIFAPHINLFNKKRFLKKEIVDKKYFNAKNMIIDFGSIKSVNMLYALNSDIYLGDVSSQAYEFLIELRPCIFINTYNIDWKENKHYQNWHLGKVIETLDNFKEILNTTAVWHKKDYLVKQEKAIAKTFNVVKGKTASQRIANEIINII